MLSIVGNINISIFVFINIVLVYMVMLLLQEANMAATGLLQTIVKM